jgi:lipid-A-disaccharide synthase
MTAAPTLRIAVVAGEPSGDQLGFKLMRALRERTSGRVAFLGVGGEAMAAEGLDSLFPLGDVAVMGVLPVLARLPRLIRRIAETAKAIVAARPDALVIIDSPDFTHRVARRARRALPDLPIVDYVSPSVWAWRPGRARAMRAYVDCVLALLPFEPAAHARLGGPRCVYVGHPLIERLGELRPNAEEARRRGADPPLVLVLPGSRRLAIARLSDDFGAALSLLARERGPFELVLPTVPHAENEVRARVAGWEVKPRVVVGEAAKLAAFRSARLALAASGTATLELALAGVPLVGAYKVSRFEQRLKRFVKLPHSILLPNLVLGERAIPEFLQQECAPAALAAALAALIEEGPARAAQLKALARLDALMAPLGSEAPSARAAAETLATIARRRGAPRADAPADA